MSSTNPEDLSIHVDFDSTLFDTQQFSKDLFLELSRQTGLGIDQIYKDSVMFKPDKTLGGYMFDEHLEYYNLDNKELWEKLNKITSNGDYLYKDSTHFIQDLIKRGYKPQILSFGEEKFQLAKIIPVRAKLLGNLGLTQLPVELTQRRKAKYIAENYSGKRGVLVDDVPEQDLPDGFTEIQLDRTSKHKVSKKENVFKVTNLNQALEIIESL